IIKSCTINDKKIEQSNINSTITTVKKLNDTLVLSNSIDRVEILCLFFGKYGDKSFTLYLSNSDIKKVNFHNEEEVAKIKSVEFHNKIIDYVNRFYINKNEKVVLKKVKRDYIKSTDYPTILVIGYKGKQQFFENKIRIGEENYNIEYNPEFIGFYNLLQSVSDW